MYAYQFVIEYDDESESGVVVHAETALDAWRVIDKRYLTNGNGATATDIKISAARLIVEE